MKRLRRSHWLPWVLCLCCVTVGGVGLFTNAAAPLRKLVSTFFDWSDDKRRDDGSNLSGAQPQGSNDALQGGKPSQTDGSEFTFDPHALPVGLTSIDGEAGEGINRAVKKKGVWFPVYSQAASASQGRPVLNSLPLTISSGPAAQGLVGEPYLYESQAIGGVPPYTWEAVLTPVISGFVFDPKKGTLSGQGAEPITATLALKVTDADGAADSVQMPLIIRPAKALAMLTESLPEQDVDVPIEIQLAAEGGVAPYHWSSEGEWPQGVELIAEGHIVGMASEAGEFLVTLRVTDQQKVSVVREMAFKCRQSLDIVSEAAMPSAAPGQPYEFIFEATGGMEPYTWEVTEGALPGGDWELSEDGRLSGTALGTEALTAFTVTVHDAGEATFQKSFRLVVSNLLTAIPSARKVGIAWSKPAVAALLRAFGLDARSFIVRRDDAAIYEGTGNNFVDHEVQTGDAPLYELVAVLVDGSLQPMASRQVTVLPMGLQRGEPGVRGDPYADQVLAYQPLSPKAYGATKIPGNVTGPPDGRSTFAPATKATEVASLGAAVGAGGFIDLAFTDNIVELGPGEDLTVFENVFFIGGDPGRRFMEAATVSVALFPGEWHRLPCDVLPPADGSPVNTRNPFYYAKGIAGVNATTGEDPTDPSRSGGDSFNLEDALQGTGLTWIRFVRIQSTGDAWLRDDFGGDLIRHENDPAFQPLSGTGSSGFDLDAVCATRER